MNKREIKRNKVQSNIKDAFSFKIKNNFFKYYDILADTVKTCIKLNLDEEIKNIINNLYSYNKLRDRYANIIYDVLNSKYKNIIENSNILENLENDIENDINDLIINNDLFNIFSVAENKFLFYKNTKKSTKEIDILIDSFEKLFISIEINNFSTKDINFLLFIECEREFFNKINYSKKAKDCNTRNNEYLSEITSTLCKVNFDIKDIPSYKLPPLKDEESITNIESELISHNYIKQMDKMLNDTTLDQNSLLQYFTITIINDQNFKKCSEYNCATYYAQLTYKLNIDILQKIILSKLINQDTTMILKNIIEDIDFFF